MIIIPQPMMPSAGGGMSNNRYKALLIVVNSLLLVFLSFLLYKFYNTSYVGTFWDFSWDSEWHYSHRNEFSDFPCVVFWLAFLLINGAASLTALVIWVENILNKKGDKPC